MVNSYLGNLGYKPHASRASSTNHKPDVINQHLQEFKIALQIMARYPNVLDEFKNAVMGACKHPGPKETETYNDTSNDNYT
jgi:hypothetical protein